MSEVERERRGPVQILRINRPEARNALNPAVLAGIGLGIQEADADPDIGVVIITGTGDKAFCAGMDLRGFAGGPGAAPSEEHKAAREAFTHFLREGAAKPVIAAANATAVGGGLELMLACDMVVASSQAKFGLPEVKRALFPAGNGVRLGQRIAPAVALEILLTGATFDAERAFALGLVNRVVPPERVLDEAVALAELVAANGPLAVKVIKTLARAAGTLPSKEFWALQAELQPLVFGSDDAREGAAAFLDKRQPVWKGH